MAWFALAEISPARNCMSLAGELPSLMSCSWPLTVSVVKLIVAFSGMKWSMIDGLFSESSTTGRGCALGASISGTDSIGSSSITGSHISGWTIDRRRRRLQKIKASNATETRPKPTKIGHLVDCADGELAEDGSAVVSSITGASGSATVGDRGAAGRGSLAGITVGMFCVVGAVVDGGGRRGGAGS